MSEGAGGHGQGVLGTVGVLVAMLLLWEGAVCQHGVADGVSEKSPCSRVLSAGPTEPGVTGMPL